MFQKMGLRTPPCGVPFLRMAEDWQPLMSALALELSVGWGECLWCGESKGINALRILVVPSFCDPIRGMQRIRGGLILGLLDGR